MHQNCKSSVPPRSLGGGYPGSERGRKETAATDHSDVSVSTCIHAEGRLDSGLEVRDQVLKQTSFALVCAPGQRGALAPRDCPGGPEEDQKRRPPLPRHGLRARGRGEGAEHRRETGASGAQATWACRSLRKATTPRSSHQPPGAQSLGRR